MMRRAAQMALVLVAGVHGLPAAPAQTPGAGQEINPGQEIDPGRRMDAAIEVSAAASAAEVMLGTTFSLFVTVIHPPDVHVALPATLPLGDAFEAMRRVTERRTRPDGTWHTEFEIEVIAWHTGSGRVPPVPVTYSMAGTIHTAYSPAVPIEVLGLAGAGSTELRDIAGPVVVTRPSTTLVQVALLLAVLIPVVMLIAAVAIIWVIMRRRKKTAAHVVPQASPSAEREALDRLDALEASGALAAEDRKPAYLAMSEIMRAYLARRFGLSTMDATTSELKRDMAAHAHTATIGEALADWLDGCDLVKYAGARASEQDARQAMQTARQAVTMGANNKYQYFNNNYSSNNNTNLVIHEYNDAGDHYDINREDVIDIGKKGSSAAGDDHA